MTFVHAATSAFNWAVYPGMQRCMSVVASSCMHSKAGLAFMPLLHVPQSDCLQQEPSHCQDRFPYPLLQSIVFGAEEFPQLSANGASHLLIQPLVHITLDSCICMSQAPSELGKKLEEQQHYSVHLLRKLSGQQCTKVQHSVATREGQRRC